MNCPNCGSSELDYAACSNHDVMCLHCEWAGEVPVNHDLKANVIAASLVIGAPLLTYAILRIFF